MKMVSLLKVLKYGSSAAIVKQLRESINQENKAQYPGDKSKPQVRQVCPVVRLAKIFSNDILTLDLCAPLWFICYGNDKNCNQLYQMTSTLMAEH